MANPIQLKRSNTAGNTPASLADGEVAVQQADGVLFYRTSASVVQKLLLPKRANVSDAAYTASVNDVYIGFTALTAPRTVTLPAAASYPPGHALYIADESGNGGAYTITVAAAGSDTIAGAASIQMSFGYQKLTFHSNGSNLWTVA